MSPTSIRLAAVAVATVPALLTTAVPAQAGDSYLSRTTGFVGVTDWVQYFDFDNPTFGNVHVGSLQAFETSPGVADVFAYIVDFECPPRGLPGPGPARLSQRLRLHRGPPDGGSGRHLHLQPQG